MLKFVGKALAGLVMTKEAQELVGHMVKAKVTPFKPNFPFPDLEGEPALALAGPMGHAMASSPHEGGSPLDKMDRAQLIRHAMDIRAAKQGVLAELDPESRAKLVALAMKALLNEGPLKG